MTDKIIIEAIRRAALVVEDRTSGSATVERLRRLNALLLGIDADARPLLSLASIDRLNAYLPTQRYVMVPLFVGLLALGFAPPLFGDPLPAAVAAPLGALLLIAQVGLLLSNLRLASFWRRGPGAGPPPRGMAALDVLKVMMTSRSRALALWLDCAWGPLWEGVAMMTIAPTRFRIMHEFRYAVARDLCQKLRRVQEDLDETGAARAPDRGRLTAEFVALCRELWVVTGEKQFREIEARGHITSDDLNHAAIHYLYL